MKILHTSDWHLGKILCGVHLTEDQNYILEDFIRLIKDVKPDVIIIAGDLYDRSVPPVEAVELLDDVLSKIILDIKIPTIVISGNHDSGDRMAFGSRLLRDRGLYIYGKFTGELKPITLEDGFGKVDFYPVPYVEPVVVKEKLGITDIHNHNDAAVNIIKAIDDNVDLSRRNVLIGHLFAAGGMQSESERPLTSVGGAEMVDCKNFDKFNYTALGHLHSPQKIGRQNIRYSGSLMKYSFSEVNHDKNMYLIDMDEKGECNIEAIKLRTRKDLRCISGTLEELLSGNYDVGNKEDYIKAVIKDKGMVYNAMGKLKEVYPNILQLEFSQLENKNEGKISGLEGDYKKLTDLDIFASFMKQINGEDIVEEYENAFKDILGEYIKRAGGEG